MSLMVDPEMLRRFGDAMKGVAESISGLDLSTPFADSETALPGTEFSKVCVDGLEATGAALRNVCLRLMEVEEVARGVAGKYEVTEDVFETMLHTMDVPS